MLKHLIWPSLALLVLSFETHATSWSISPSNSCSSVTVTLPSPTLDIGCNLDTESGNPSSWFNPMASCSMDFDLIGLPTIGDITAGLVGQVCSEIQKVKENTIDKVISDINDSIPDEIIGDIDIGLDINDHLNDGTGTTGQPQPPTVNPPTSGGTPDDSMCYTKDSKGKTITVPCSIADTHGETPNTCYLKDGDALSDNWRKVSCNRPTVDYELCVDGYERTSTGNSILRYDDGVPVPTTRPCKALSHNQILDNACFDPNYNLAGSSYNAAVKGRIVECSRLGLPENQFNLMCNVTDTSTGHAVQSEDVCINVEETCYGHINGIFKADSCKVHTIYYENNYGIHSSISPRQLDNIGSSGQRSSGQKEADSSKDNDEYVWEW